KESILLLNRGLRLSKISQDDRPGFYINLAFAFHQTGRDSLALIAISRAKKGLKEGDILKAINWAEQLYRRSNNNTGFVASIKNTPTVESREEDYRKLKNTDALGDLIMIISFEIKKNNKKEYPDGYAPSISLDHPEKEMKDLVDKNYVASPLYNVHDICILYDYPLKHPCTICSHFVYPITKKELVESISQEYHLIYKEEEETSTIKTLPPLERNSEHERNETFGKYGIWAHDLSDLRLKECLVYRRNDDSILLTVKIEN
ncbi:MAG TPA: hypothetical protein VGG71_04555, partial [Chitinophagaceae bacterium]